ncbi:MAG: TIGR01621 family pseudouridine synthase [Kangiellaceae bacterium]
MLSIIENNLDYLIVEKPPEVSFHNQQETLGLQQRLEQQTQIKLWPVHRLDKITSGLVIFAKSAPAAAIFGELFEKRQVKKVYLAISDKKPKKKMGKICGDMVKARSGSWKLTLNKSNPAISEFRSQSLSPGIRLFAIKPTTGKTHQIRVALKSIGSPILGDARYGGTESDRGYLHSYSLEFMWQEQLKRYHVLPSSGQYFLHSSMANLTNKLVESFS